MIHLEVQDWGCGFEPLAVLQESSPGEHVGLRTIQERVELIGGHLTISSHPGTGTLIVAEVPLLPSDERSISMSNHPLPQQNVHTSAAGLKVETRE
jgi:signal transduction histidine kinase